MNETAFHHLEVVSRLLGGFLRGFSDPSVHVGTEKGFSREIEKALNYACLRLLLTERVHSYSEMLASPARLSPSIPEWEPVDPVSVLLWGLLPAGPAPGPDWTGLSQDELRESLMPLLRLPLLLYFFQSRDAVGLIAHMQRFAEQSNAPFLVGDATPKTDILCPSCEKRLNPIRSRWTFECGSCLYPFGSAVSLSMVPGVAGRISYEMLRNAVASDLVECYQEEGDIRLSGSGAIS